MNVNIEIEITEYRVNSPKNYHSVMFNAEKESVVISFLDKYEKVIVQTEVLKSEFLNAAKIIEKI